MTAHVRYGLKSVHISFVLDVLYTVDSILIYWWNASFLMFLYCTLHSPQKSHQFCTNLSTPRYFGNKKL